MASRIISDTLDLNNAAYCMWLQGKNDFQIAKEFYCVPMTVCAWRQRHGLPDRYNKARMDVHRSRLAAYNDGLTDRAIAERLGSSVDAIKNWRMRQHLRANKSK